ncbi:Tfp pilus assembly protein PilO [Desulfocapsa sulfexigens DSM 10523]|uniref:Tfp pilus assembly protein PilO n=1 Tax=Desulfocapsa sulfexigens (strain DSM 10523 / SB164P1) TaxID=1167006 RepID=M1NC61_DESSD|nr:type 4a pilus biogenesis protein PilO [Desulfocapsa sulfexigens]AGF77374.1 Tfp pilus assembly protein PilO [Desulfocapsa sulfexigens DSM 10523]
MKKTNAFATFIDEKYIPLDKKLKIALAVILFLLPVVLFYFLWLQPHYKNHARLTQQKAAMTQELQKAKAKAANKGKLQAELDATEELFAETATLLPKEKEIPSLLTNISALGRGSGLDFLTFKPNADIPRDFYSEIPVDIKVRGPYHNMGIFLNQVSKLDRIVTVANINMGGPKKEGSEMLLNSSCRLVTYQFTNVQISKQEDPKKKRKKRR